MLITVAFIAPDEASVLFELEVAADVPRGFEETHPSDNSDVAVWL